MEKLERLKSILQSYESVLVAFSGGVDSALVLKVAHDVLGPERAKAATAKSDSLAARELEAACFFTESFKIEHRILETEEMKNPAYLANPANRCYHCKTELYDRLIPLAESWGLKTIINGTNVDDLGDIRPGLEAAREHGVRSPLVEAGITKEEVRTLAQYLNLEIWAKPASPCLSSRIPYGEEVTPEKLRQIESGENYLKDLGFQILRLRHFGRKARLELGKNEFVRLMDPELRNQVTQYILSLGFKTVVLESYRPGNLNVIASGAQQSSKIASDNSILSSSRNDRQMI